VRSFARTWIVDLKGRDIRVNVLSPGYTATPGLSHFMTDEERASSATSVAIDPNACLSKRSRVKRISPRR
jgi:NAD(P)-dependent dehydrogenase (short-subunit alcohol dehydrogenase family)